MSALTEELSRWAGLWQVVPSLVTVFPGPSPTQLVGANPLRWALLVSQTAQPPGAGSYVTVGPDPLLSGARGWYMVQGTQLDWSYRNWGGLVQRPWFAMLSGAPSTQTWVCEVLAQQ